MRRTTMYQEDTTARTIEAQIAKIPSGMLMWASLASMGVSLLLQVMGMKERSLFIGQWAPTFLILGIYSKLVRMEERD